MNIKHILLLPGVLALTLTAAPFLPVSAQSQTAPNQAAPSKRGMDRLNLSETQKTQMQQIRQNTKSEIAAYLQSQGITIPEGQNPREAMRSLNLSDTQKAQLKAIYQKGKDQAQALLTTEQKAMMQQRRGKMKDRMQQRRQGQPGQTTVQPGI